MSGYLEVKYPFKSNIGRNPFKSWKRQWCILRPSPTRAGGGSLAVYCTEAGAGAGSVEFPPGSAVRRANSRSRPHAFAVFAPGDPQKARILLAAPTASEALNWMDKIRIILNSNKLQGDTLHKDSFSITVAHTELSRQWGLSDIDGSLALSPEGLLVSQQAPKENAVLIPWSHVTSVRCDCEVNQRICVLCVDSGSSSGPGVLKLVSPSAVELVSLVNAAISDKSLKTARRLSKSDSDLRSTASDSRDIGESCQDCWKGSHSDISLDTSDLLMAKQQESKAIPSGALSRCVREGNLAPRKPPRLQQLADLDDNTYDRKSLLSIASGIYEEIPDLPPTSKHNERPMNETCDVVNEQDDISRDENKDVCRFQDCVCRDENKDVCSFQDGVSRDENKDVCRLQDGVSRDENKDVCRLQDGVSRDENKDVSRFQDGGGEEPTYESVWECAHAAARRPPPPLPPRTPFGTKGDSWNSRVNRSTDSSVSRHSSLGSLPRCCAAASSRPSATLPKNKTFSVFRKRLKSESTITHSPKDTSPKDDTKKKRFDFTPTKDLFKNFKVGRKMKSLKIASTNLTKIGETKSCEFLDETEHVTANRCSKSVECLDDGFDETDLSIDCGDDVVASLSLPKDIVELILRSRERGVSDLKNVEDDYMPMSPIVPPPIEQHYIVMSPRSNLA